MTNEYALKPLETLIIDSLNILQNGNPTTDTERIKQLTRELDQETKTYQARLKQQVFALLEEPKIRLLISQYHTSLMTLYQKIIEQEGLLSNAPGPECLLKKITGCLEELLIYTETRFSKYLEDEYVSPVLLLSLQADFVKRLELLKSKIPEGIRNRRLMEMALSVFNPLILQWHNKNSLITFRELQYRKELLKLMKQLEYDEEHLKLNELLVSMNFNSQSYLSYYIGRIREKLNALEDAPAKADLLLFHLKYLKQIPQKPNIMLHQQNQDLKLMINSWLKEEARYLIRKLRFQLPVSNQGKGILSKNPVNSKDRVKVLCKLSVDQMGLILRAADELRILMAKSMNEVFKTIVPYLSSPYKKELSPDSMRSKSYVAETRDKVIAIEALKEMIEKIRQY